MILDRVLAAAGDEDDVVDARRDRFLDAVLNDRLVDERKHFLGLSFCRRQEAGTETGGGEDGFANADSHERIVAEHSEGRGHYNQATCWIPHTFVTTSRRSVKGCETAASMPTRCSQDIATLESLRKRLIGEYEGLKRQQNTSGDEIAKAKRQGQDTSHIQEAGRLRNQQIKQLGIQLDSIEHQRDAALLTLPNLPHDTVPVGKTSADNPEARRHGEPRAFDFEPKAHWDLGTALGIIDFERATKISGARFRGA